MPISLFMDYLSVNDGEDVLTSHSSHLSKASRYNEAQVQRKPVPQLQRDMQANSRRSENGTSEPLSSPRMAQFQSDYGSYVPISPVPAVQSPNHGQRPAPVSTDSFFSTIPGDSIYLNDTQNSHTRLLGAFPAASPPYLPLTLKRYNRYLKASWLRFSWGTSKWTMYVLFALGIAGAISHHAFYASLSGAEAQDQLLMLRYGAVLAYLTKACLVSSAVWAFRQQIWATFQRKLISIAGIDSLFAAMEDPSEAVNLELLRKAKVAVFLAAVVWIAPLSVILTPATLTVEPSIFTNETTCSSVRTLNFTPKTVNDWRKPTKILGLPELSLSYWNETTSNLTDPKSFDYYTSPSQPIQQVATLSAYLQKPVVRGNAAVDVCGLGWNCSFIIHFTGPGYKCLENNGSNTGGNLAQNAPFNTSMLVPQGNFSYFALTDLGDYAPIQVESGDAGHPVDQPPYPPHLGAFRTEPVLWIGRSDLQNPNVSLPPNSSDSNWSSSFQNQIFSCEHYKTEYTVLFNYSAGLQNTLVTNRTYLNPIINTIFMPNISANDGTKDNTTATPEENYIYPSNLATYRLTAAYHSLGSIFRQFVNGTIDFQDPEAPITNTQATQTKLVNPHNYLAVPNLMDQVQSFYEDIILSLFSNPQFLAVAWAGNVSELSGTGTSTTAGQYPCVKSRVLNRFVYHRRDLWLVYSAMILLTGVSVALGTMAIKQNGGTMKNTRFSSIVAATRSPGLEKLELRRPSGWGHMPNDVGKMKLGYGLVGHRGDVNEVWIDSYGFGVEGEVRQVPSRSSISLPFNL